MIRVRRAGSRHTRVGRVRAHPRRRGDLGVRTPVGGRAELRVVAQRTSPVEQR